MAVVCVDVVGVSVFNFDCCVVDCDCADVFGLCAILCTCELMGCCVIDICLLLC